MFFAANPYVGAVDNRQENPVIITAAFIGLNGRPREYYVRPASDLARQAPARLWTQRENGPLFGVPTLSAEPSELADEFWKPGWRDHYASLVKHNPGATGNAQDGHPEVLGAWLGKLVLMGRTFDADPSITGVLWWDAGLPVTVFHGGDASQYKGLRLDSGTVRRGLSSLAEHPIALVKKQRMGLHFWMPWLWMDECPRPDGAEAQWIHPCPFVWARRDAFAGFYAGVKSAWMELIDAGKGGTEENAVTLWAWRNAPVSFTLGEWMSRMSFLMNDVQSPHV